ncbi:MAG: hypothetical protein ACLQBD_26090 [Syntrophobacteraceae bacterium]
MSVHYRRDNPNGITAPNPDAPKDMVSHITKHRGMKTAYTSVSEDKSAIEHFSGELYKTESDHVVRDKHIFHDHSSTISSLNELIQTSRKGERVVALRALQLAKRAKEALIDWQFSLDSVDRNERITWVFRYIQRYFSKA